MIYISQQFGSLFTPLVVINPLGFYGLAAISGLLAAVCYYFRNRSLVNAPQNGKLPVTQFFNKVPLFQGIRNVGAFQRFNSSYHFLAKTFFHNRYVLVSYKSTKPYNGSVYNLSVWKDESYITRLGIAHNCRCYVVQTAEPADKGEVEDPDVKEEFRINVGKRNELMSPKHKYFAITQNTAAEGMINNQMAWHTNEQARKWAKTHLVENNKKLKNPELPAPAPISNRDVKTVLNKPHQDRVGRAWLMKDLLTDFEDAVFVKSEPESKGRAKYITWYYFKSKAGNYYYNFVELATGEMKLHAITDGLKE